MDVTRPTSDVPEAGGVLIAMAVIVILVIIFLFVVMCYTDQSKFRACFVKCCGGTFANKMCDFCCPCTPPPEVYDPDECYCSGCDGERCCDETACDCSKCRCKFCPKYPKTPPPEANNETETST